MKGCWRNNCDCEVFVLYACVKRWPTEGEEEISWNLKVNLVYLHVHEYSLLLRNFLLMISLHVLLLTFFKNVRRVKIIWLNFFLRYIYYLETTVTKKEICLVIFIIYLFLKIKKVKYVFTPCKLICPSHTSLCLGYRE